VRYQVIIQRRAEQDLWKATAWIAQFAPETAERWCSGFLAALETLTENPMRCGFAPENSYVDYDIRQLVYRTKSRVGNRALFTIIEDQVRVLRIRRPGEDLVWPDEL
jgi:plasmid stabilization system protein ParE